MNEQTHNCKNGGQMTERPPQTPEQEWCGTWFYCAACGTHSLIESDELNAQNAKFFDEWLKEFDGLTRKKDREKFLKNHEMYQAFLIKRVNPWRITESA